ncbi:MAG: 2-hydroxyglutaryl-CoA dehydratase [Planctomycetes bacterium]|nr:2-hydroxyglutaryl-CoA dehydratase [Planctomycetota bacterium]
MSFVAGLDLGAGSTKAVIIDQDGRIVADSIRRTGADFHAIGRATLDEAYEKGGLRPEEVVYIATTGFGRYIFDDRSIQITDLTCAARGAHALFPDARFVLDMGAQSTRAISLREGGKVRSFRTNEKCAAGSGGFLERVARYLEVPLDTIGEISAAARDPQPISSVCAVLAETEIINHVSEGRSVADIICGAHLSLAERALSQLKRVAFDGPVVFVGGVALQKGMVTACEAKFGQPVYVPEKPSHVVAYGAALLGLQRLSKRSEQEVAV